MSEIVVELNKLVEKPIEYTVQILGGFTVGQLKSFSNSVKLKYSEVEMVKNQLLNFKQLESTPKEDIDKANEVLDNLYIALQKIEDINNVAIELIKAKEL